AGLRIAGLRIAGLRIAVLRVAAVGVVALRSAVDVRVGVAHRVRIVGRLHTVVHRRIAVLGAVERRRNIGGGGNDGARRQRHAGGVAGQHALVRVAHARQRAGGEVAHVAADEAWRNVADRAGARAAWHATAVAR